MKKSYKKILTTITSMVLACSLGAITAGAVDSQYDSAKKCAQAAKAATGMYFTETTGITNGAVYKIRNAHSGKYLDYNTSSKNVHSIPPIAGPISNGNVCMQKTVIII